jgi:deoxyribodipyrimidine photolyase-related protein
MARSKAAPKPPRNLILVLGDQLTPTLSSLSAGDPAHDLVLMAEVHDETTYVRHHKKKIAFVLSAMRHFADELRSLGWRVVYARLDDPENAGSFGAELARAAAALNPERISVTEPGEWRIHEMMQGWAAALGRPVEILADDRFICRIDEFQAWARGRKQLRMEYFYRDMRRKTGLLMDGDEPAGGQWNFDHDNRKSAAGDLFMPPIAKTAPDAITREVLALVEARFANHFGTLRPFWFATRREDAEAVFDHFIAHALAGFGDYQDAMLAGEKFLYHSLISMYLNVGLLDPLAICRKVEAAWRNGRVPLNAAEGYIRQVIGWREYVRGIYWREMPDYIDRNHLGAERALPDFYWTAETPMTCVRSAVEQTRDEAYAHHIQRLMVTGTFALLAGIHPKAVHEWYLAVYADAYEWVELPNTLGMSQFADGGLLASKPYAASGAYINRMSDYCGSCAFDVKARTGPKACPFNYLYWDFIDRHRTTVGRNPRIAQMVRTFDKFAATEQQRIRDSAAEFLAPLSGTGKD